MVRIVLLGALIMALAACEGESREIEALQQKMCEGAAWPNAAQAAEDTPLHQRFGNACSAIHRLEGVKIEGAEHVWLCRSFLAVENLPAPAAVADQPPRKAVIAAFGAEMVHGGIMPVHRFMGVHFAALILADAQDNPQEVITQMDQLKSRKTTLESVASAAGWAYMMGALGEGYDPKALCRAEISAGDNGWTFAKADVFVNCQPRQWRSIAVTRDGAVQITASTPQLDEDGNSMAVCID